MQIHVAEHASNQKGDLLTSRTRDLVHALGYDVTRLNVHKSGREIDIIGRHRLEARKLVVECKAQAQLVGGADINKFVGTMDAEREQGQDLSGYYFSISGFTSSALEQESALGRQRCVLMGPDEIVAQLISANVLAPSEKLMLAVGAFVASKDLEIDPNYDVVVHNSGWLYLVYFIREGVRSAAALTYASGRVMTVASAIAVVDDLEMPSIAALEILGTSASDGVNKVRDKAKDAYFKFLGREYGVIRHEGMPLDAEFGAGSPVALESLYVPQRLQRLSGTNERRDDFSKLEPFEEFVSGEQEGTDVAEIMLQSPHISVLGPPGSGKSTLVKRLAIAYASRDRMLAVDDDLPQLDLFPVVLRCRELPVSWSSIQDIIESVAKTAELAQYASTFVEITGDAADQGHLLLLVDGLDEVADSSERLRLSHQLRTFLGRYPAIHLVITSREAGFRLVAGSMSEFAVAYRLAELSRSDITSLTASWCTHVYGSSTPDVARAATIADGITKDWRLRRLASTPLLLTMLLLVQRWTGGAELPKKRSVLYKRAVEVLLNTWNVEGHKALDLDEALPQLAYVAYAMTERGEQRISHSAMQKTISEARAAMPDVLGYAKVSPSEFINNVESRSSLIIQAGHAQDDGKLQATYEFRHLMFQEYLTAVAASEGWCEGSPEQPLVERMGAYLEEPRWSEVVTLVSVIAGRRGGALVAALHEKTLARVEPEPEPTASSTADFFLQTIEGPLVTLRNCMVDDAQLQPQLAEQILHTICRSFSDETDFEGIYESRYFNQFRVVVQNGLTEDNELYVPAAVYLLLADYQEGGDLQGKLITMLTSTSTSEQGIALRSLVSLAYQVAQTGPQAGTPGFTPEKVLEILEATTPLALACAEQLPAGWVQNYAFWALAWIFDVIPSARYDVDLLVQKLVSAYENPPLGDSQHYSGWLLLKTLRKKEDLQLEMSAELLQNISVITQRILVAGDQTDDLDNRMCGFLVLAYYASVVGADLLISTVNTRGRFPKATFEGFSD